MIMDRYSYCQVAAARCLGIRNAWIVERLYCLFPPPDLTLMVHVTPNKALCRLTARNTDPIPMTLSFLEGHQLAYSQLPEAASFVVVDGARPIHEVHDQIRERVLARFPFLSSNGELGGGTEVAASN